MHMIWPCPVAAQEFVRLVLSLPAHVFLQPVGVSTSADVSRRYRRLMVHVHPDKLGGSATEKEKECARYIIEEYQTLLAWLRELERNPLVL